MWGAAIAYIILGSVLYRFRSKFRLIPSRESEKIGFAMWWGGWIALLWWIVSLILSFPAQLSHMGLVFATFWAGLISLKIARDMNAQLKMKE
jgi:ABC-type Co2+ transport system permease subunit